MRQTLIELQLPKKTYYKGKESNLFPQRYLRQIEFLQNVTVELCV